MRRSTPVDIRELQKKYTKEGEGGAVERKQIIRVNRPLSGKAALMEEEQWIENILEDQEADISEERRKELGEKLAEIKERLKHIQSRPPTKVVKATEDIPIGLYERYKGTSGKLPEPIVGILEGVDLEMPEIEKQARYERLKKEGKEARAAQEAVSRLEKVSEEKAVEGDLDEPIQISEEILEPIKRGRKKGSFAAVEEDRSWKSLRIRRGYKDVVTVDANKLKNRFEQDNNEDLVWRPLRFDLLKDIETFDRYPEVDITSSGKIDFNDGRHRVAVAASRGETIPVAVRNKAKFLDALEQ